MDMYQVRLTILPRHIVVYGAGVTGNSAAMGNIAAAAIPCNRKFWR